MRWLRTSNPLLQISYIALDSPDARPQVKEMLLSACASAAAAAGGAMHPHPPALLPRLERCLDGYGGQGPETRAGAGGARHAGERARGTGGDGGARSRHHGRRRLGVRPGLQRAEGVRARHVRRGGGSARRGVRSVPAGLRGKAAASLRLDDGVVYDSDEEEHDRARQGMVPGGIPTTTARISAIRTRMAAAAGTTPSSAASRRKPRRAKPCLPTRTTARTRSKPTSGRSWTRWVTWRSPHARDGPISGAPRVGARMAQCALSSPPPPSVEAFPNRRRLAQRDATRGARGRRQRLGGAAMESAAEVIKSVAALAGGGESRTRRARGTPQGPQRPLPRRAGGPSSVPGGRRRGHWAEEGAGDADDGDDPEEEDEEAELGQIVLEGVAELLPALAAVGGRARAGTFSRISPR